MGFRLDETLEQKVERLERDLAQCREENESLREKAHMLEAIFQGLPAATVFADTERRIRMANPAVESTFGYKPGEVLGHHTSVFYESQEAYEEQGRLRYNLSAEDKLKPYELNYRRKSGEIFPSETVGAQVRDANGDIIGFLGIMSDITERHELAALRGKVNMELENRVRERTEELRALTRTLSHDLRNPLIAIAGFANLLCRRMADSGGKPLEYAERIKDAVEWVQELLNDLVSLLRASDSQLDLSRVELGKLVSKVVSMNAAQFEERKIKIAVADDLPSARCDRYLIRRVLDNLVQNAVKYCGGTEGARLVIDATAEEGAVTVTFTDNGRGVDPEHHKAIFEPFMQVQSREEGSGLGLAISRRLVQLHGGDLWVESEGEGMGSAFKFTLPAANVNADPQIP